MGIIAAGLLAAVAAVYGHRGQRRVTESGVLITGYGGLVDQLQEERADLREKLAQSEARLAEAYADLAQERTDRTAAERQITALTAERDGLRARIAVLEGGTP